MVSTMMTPPRRKDVDSATALTIGPSAFGNAWTSTIRTAPAPFSRAISMYEDSNTVTSAARVIRAICPTPTSASVPTGIASSRIIAQKSCGPERNASAGSHRSFTANTSTAMLAIRNSGTDTIPMIPIPTMRS